MFEPKADVAQWRLVYDTVRTLSIGDTIPYERLSEVLARDFTADRGPIYRAITELEREDKRTLDVVPRVGYRVVDAPEHERLARRHHRRSRRQLGKAHSKLASADRARLNPEQRAKFDALELTVSRHEDMIRRLDGRVEKHDAAIKDNRRTTKELEARVDELAERLARAGIETPAGA